MLMCIQKAVILTWKNSKSEVKVHDADTFTVSECSIMKLFSSLYDETNLSYTPQLGAQLRKILNSKSHHRKHPLKHQI
jgi:hypothetical protein